ncbi:alpha-L-iduronidase-like [Littorina saxatilis]|uniref:Alpha-L-iduronidase n=1 Tax=Littorina saxatilis TaxID=31220 RepID=A0AAN9B1T1_9CAEN
MSRRLCVTEALLTMLIICLHCASGASRQDLKLVVRAQSNSSPFRQFWRSTGFCPPLPHQAAADFDLSPDMEQNLAYIGAVPHSGVEQVRIHWLLDLVKVKSFSSGQPVYDFTSLDQLIDMIHVNGLKPGFEVMGSPSSIFTHMENKTQVYWFKDLVKQVAQRYISQYGLDYIKTWNFETWNEPDCHDFDELNITTQGLFNYYDACSEGLKAANPQLIFGGPGNACSGGPLRKRARTHMGEALIGHAAHGINYFTGEKGVRMDYISLHHKGGGQSLPILQAELQSMQTIRSQYPSLAHLPFMNDEADPLVHWSRPEIWRATAMYAAVAVKIIGQHQNMLIGPDKSPLNYTLLSNDNGFLSYFPHQFTQRTLVARFQMNATRNNSRSLDDSGSGLFEQDGGTINKRAAQLEDYVTFVRKPIHSAMVLLAKLGDQVVSSDVLDQQSGHALSKDDYAGAIATVHTPSLGGSDGNEWAAVLYSSPDTSTPSKHGMLIFDWTIKPTNAADLMLAIYAVNNIVSNPYSIWTNNCKSADFPSLEQFSLIRKFEGPSRYSLTAVKSDVNGVVSIPALEVMEPDVVLLHLCQKSPHPPEAVTGLRMINITAGERLIRWSDANIKTKCIKTYDVEFAPGSTGYFNRINPDDIIANAFVFSTDSESKVLGRYRVRAVDYWNRAGPYSSTLEHIH